jgi:2-haloacid dehalogenase
MEIARAPLPPRRAGQVRPAGDGGRPGCGDRALTSVLFDLGGVFFDWDPRYLYARLFGDDRDAMEDFLANVAVPGGEWHLQMDAGRPIADCCAELAALHPEQASLIWAWADPDDEMVRGVFDGTVEILADLRALGVPCYAVSNMEGERYERRRREHAFLEWFDGVFISGFEGVVKPDPQFFNLALERFGLSPEDVVFIDDRPANVATAEALGIASVLFQGPGDLRARLAELGVMPLP